MAKNLSEFLLGIDLSCVAIDRDDCSSAFGNMTRLQWIKLASIGIDSIPTGIEKLTTLQRLTVSKNKLNTLSGNWLAELKNLRFFDARKNCLTNDSIPEEFFHNSMLQVLDLSFNLLTDVPKGLVHLKSLLVLNLSNNQLSSVPKDLFDNFASIMILDLSNNQLTTFPAKLRLMPNLQSLNLSNNNIDSVHLLSLSGLKKLTCLYLSNTARRLDNFPPDIDRLQFLSDLDISDNSFKRLPQTVYEIRSLTKLNFSGNDIDELCGLIDCWPNLKILNMSRNKLIALPSFITRLLKLRKLYIDDNQLNFNGIPPGVGKLLNLEVFSASNNFLENIPEGLCRCGQLKQLNLRSNRLVTLPDAIHVLMESLIVFNIDNNPNLKMPPKLDEADFKDKYKYYNIDFSLDTQMQLARGAPLKPPTSNTPQKDTASRIRRLRRKKLDDSSNGAENDSDSKCVLEGMKKVAKDKDAILEEREKDDSKKMSSKHWQASIEKPNLDYSQLFEDDVGKLPGLEKWEIDDFYPKKVEEELMHGSFCNGDCYIVLHTGVDEKTGTQLTWSIYYWIGSAASLDKVTCSAVHAVNLRNFLNAECRCEREEENDESDEFKALFNGRIEVIEGAHGTSGFLLTDERQHRKKLYRLFGADKTISLYTCDTSPTMLDSKFVYLFDESYKKLYLWIGKRSRLMLQTKGRLLVDKINQRERKGQSEIIIERDGDESEEFKISFSEPEKPFSIDWTSLPRDHISLDWKPAAPILYNIKVGSGTIEMPQIEIPLGRLSKSLLEDKHVHILDSNGEVYVWIGYMSPKFLKFAGIKLAYQMVELLPKSIRRTPILCYQPAEPHIFKMQFCDWEDAVAVDFTRSAESVRKRGDINDIMENDKIKIDMRSFFMPREKSMPWEEAMTTIEDCNDEIAIDERDTSVSQKYHVKQFVWANRKWVLVEDKWVGHFFCEDTYLVHVEYYEIPDEDEDEEDEEQDNKIQTVIYFWQGREASDVPWLQFNFSLKKEMEIRFSGVNEKAISKDDLKKVEFKRQFQQQELSQFLAHFHLGFVVHLGKYQDRNSEQRKKRVEMYYLRGNGSALYTRTIEVKPLVQFLNSCYHYIVKIPARLTNSGGDHVICWIGKNSDSHYDAVLEAVAKDTFGWDEAATIITVKEGDEPEIFWTVLGGRAAYDSENEYMKFSRLFRLSNEQGFFCASEKCTDFCQDDLADDDVMLLDTGSQIYLWFGNRTSEVEKKLSLQAAKLYKEHMNRIQPERNRQLKITQKKKEPHLFRRCFHGWGPFKEVKDWSG